MYVELYLKKPKKSSSSTYSEELPSKDKKMYYIKTFDEGLRLGKFFLNYVNDYCNTFVGPYDVDSLDSNQCKLLKNWISNNRELIIDNNLVEIFSIIEEFCTEAISLDTGIEIEC